MSIPANGERSFTSPVPKGAGKAAVSISYRLVNDEVRTLLKLKDKQWGEKKLIDKAIIRF